MKLLLTMNLPYTRIHGGTNRSNRNLAEALARQQHQVCVVVPALATPPQMTKEMLRQSLQSEGLEVTITPSAFIFVLNGVEVHAILEPAHLRTYLMQQIQRVKPDWVLVSAEDPSQNLLSTALKEAPSRVIYLAHTPQMFPFGPASLYPGTERAKLVGQAAGIVAISQYVADYIHEHTGLDVFVNHPPHYGNDPFPDLSSFHDGYVLMMNASEIKGLSIFLQLAKSLPHIPFAALPGYATTTADREALMRLPNVTILENLPGLDDIFRRTRILLMPTLWMEGFGMAVVDAMLRGIPVLASDYGGLAEAKLGTEFLLPVQPITEFKQTLGENLLPIPVVPLQDIAPWLKALEALLTNEDRYKQHAATSRQKASAFVTGLSVAPLEDFLQRLQQNPIPKRLPNPIAATPADNDAEAKVRLAQLSPQQRAFLMMRLRQKTDQQAKNSKPILQPIFGGNEHPLSPAQQRLWFLNQLDPGNPVYNMPAAVHIRGILDVPGLEKSLQQLAERHALLRTTFVVKDNGEPAQVVAANPQVTLTHLNLESLPRNQREQAISEQTLTETTTPFDLMQGPLWRVKLLQINKDDHIFILTMHHIISDGWSLKLFVQELIALYTAHLAGQPHAALPPLSVQYTDFAHWQRAWETAGLFQEQLIYWQEKLGGELPILELPADRPRPPVQTYHGAYVSTQLPTDLTQLLKSWQPLQTQQTLFAPLLAAFKTLLYRYTGQTDLLIGTPVANRNQRELENLIGFFVNTLVIRTQPNAQLTFHAYLKQVQQTVLTAFSHQDVPFEKLVEVLQPKRDLSRPPLFQVMFVFAQDEPLAAMPVELSVTPTALVGKTAKFDLTLFVTETADSIQIAIEYNTDLFMPATIERLLAHYQTLLRAVMADDHQLLIRLPLLTDIEQHNLLETQNKAPLDFSQTVCLHELVAMQAAQTPTAPALVFAATESPDDLVTLTYATLNQRADQLASYLQTMGIGAEVPVGICMHRSPEMVIGILAILKAGGAYVPLDPAYPQERLAFILADSQAPIVLTQQSVHALLPVSQVRTVCLDTDWDMIAAGPTKQTFPSVSQQMAYIIYTSGSTGHPKGVTITHRNAVAFIAWTHTQFSKEELAGVLASTSICFDLSVFELFAPLSCGGQIVMADNMLHLLALPTANQVTLINTVPSALAELLKVASLPSSIHTVNVAGEPFAAELVQQVYQQPSVQRMLNLYGPSEDTTYSTYACLPADLTEAPAIGGPVANTQVYLLDRHMQPMPLGIPGEIYLAGEGVTRGYWKRPSLTATRFIPNPFAQVPGDRLYKTGDLARYLPDGQLVFMGRVDHQVKLHGFRIEMGEIERTLQQHPQVDQAVVTIHENQQGQKSLVAYLVPHPKRPLPDLNDYPHHQLPNGMEIVYQSQIEAEHIYEDIFERRCYLQHGIVLEKGACVFDVGGNIGLFSLFAHEQCADISIYAFEPAAPLYDLFCINTAMHGVNVKPINVGLSHTAGTATLTFYPQSSGMSSFYADAAEEKAVLQTIMQNQLAQGMSGMAELMPYADELLEERFKSESLTCELRTLSQVIAAEKINVIDLLKIDVQKSEQDVLDGIAEADWPKIKQIVMEVHDLHGNLAEVKGFLQAKGFAVVVDQDPLMKGSVLYNLYARRQETREPKVPHILPHPLAHLREPIFVEKIRQFLRQRLPHYMIPNHFMLLPALPLMPNGKIDRRALPAPQIGRSQVSTVYVAPQTSLEKQIESVWRSVLHIEKVGIHDNFFDLGGHSLLLLQLHHQLQQELQQGFTIVDLFTYPTIHTLATHLRSNTLTDISLEQSTKRAQKRQTLTKRHQRTRRQA